MTGMSCASAVYQAFSNINPSYTSAPVPRSEGGKCGAVLAAEKVIREIGLDKTAEFDKEFQRNFGSLKCSELLGNRKGSCNDFVGTSAMIVEKLWQSLYTKAATEKSGMDQVYYLCSFADLCCRTVPCSCGEH